MKSLQFIVAFFLIFTSVLITSCETEPLDSDLLAQLNNGGGTDGGDGDGGTDGGGGTGGGTGGGGSTGGGTTTSSFTAKVGSFNFVAQDFEAELSESDFGKELNITGTTSNGKVINIQLINPAAGTFRASFDFNKLLIFQYFEDSNINSIFSSFDILNNTSVGSLTITKFDSATKKISGTFSFTGFDYQGSSNKRQITNGVLDNVSYTIAP